MEESQLSEGNRKVFDEKKLIDNKDMSAHTDLTIGDLKLQGDEADKTEKQTGDFNSGNSPVSNDEGPSPNEKSIRPEEHVVRNGETLNSISAMYDVTPSEMTQCNKLGISRFIFPGQILKIPPPAPPPASPKENLDDLEVVEYQFIKLRVRHITAGRGVVGGSILFTPNAIIFDPDPADPLVEELEPEAFQIIAPMEFVVNAAIFLDFFPIGNTGKTSGKEYPPSQIFRLDPKVTKITAKRDGDLDEEKKGDEEKLDESQQREGSNYSLSEEGKESEKIENNSETSALLTRSDPLYLRLTMGKPVGREVSKSTPTMAYGLQMMMPEYWFIVPAKQILNLYRFFMTWFPEIYVPFDLEEIHENGFELVPEPDLSSAEPSGPVNSASRIIQKTMTMNSIDLDILMPELTEKSDLLSDDQRKLLYRYLPPRVQGSGWSLMFSSSKDGFSLHSLYRKAALVDSPVLIVIQDTDHAVFGALISCPPVMSESFMGTGESWLFTFYPSFKVYEWTGENNFIVRGGQSSLVVGSSDGHFGLWLDENFNQGRSMAVSTFKNKPLPGKEDFQINNIECWVFV